MRVFNSKGARVLTATVLTSSLVLSSGYSILAASKREAWNNAASSKETGTVLDNGDTVYSNVYADATAWESWKTQWTDIRDNFEQIALTPGKDETEMNFAWYSKTVETPAIRITDKDGNPTGSTFYGEQTDTISSVTEDDVTTTLYPNKVTITGLEANTTYYYQYLVNGKFSDTYSFSTKDSSDFSVLYVGDPQIGASTGQEATEENTFTNSKEYYARNDAYNWNQTLNNAISANPDVSFLLSAGDQINQTSVSKAKDELQQQVEYSGFLYPSVLRSLPIATTIGNHDSKSVNYQNHFNNPNSYAEEVGASTAGNDYYFTYGDVLFVVINTNNYNCQTHKDLINKAIEENSDVKWKVLMFHQDIYGSGADHSDSDGMILRTQLTPIIDEAGFDAVLQGHDHTYSRTYQISADEGTYPAYTSTSGDNFQSDNTACYDIVTKETDSTKVVNPEGTVYFEANSSTGSKFYQLIGTQQDYIAARSQSWRPTYSVIEFDEVSMTVKTYDAATNEELVADGGLSTSYTIVKSVDKTELETKIAKAEELLNKTDVYTEESLASLAEVITAAKEIAANDEAKTVDVASAYTSVDEAINALEEIKADDTQDDGTTDDGSSDSDDTTNNDSSNNDTTNNDSSDNTTNDDSSDNTANNGSSDNTTNDGSSNTTSNNDKAQTGSSATQVSTSNPKTGDSMALPIASTLTAIASAIGLVVLKLKGKRV